MAHSEVTRQASRSFVLCSQDEGTACEKKRIVRCIRGNQQIGNVLKIGVIFPRPTHSSLRFLPAKLSI